MWIPFDRVMTAIEVENVGKMYRLGLVGTGTLTHDINRIWARMRGKEDPFAKIAQSNKRDEKGESKYVWALKDIDFEVRQGEVFGIIGKNGAGKSTLLKLLARVTGPTNGQIRAKGRIASLLEVGTGFHPELTGRENIFLNGAILGMTKREIRAKFDEIVAFSGVERYVDTPVKRYSSGMYVRLAFAVAAHLEPEILIVDEVLAVGDVEFQKKCVGKMQDVSRNSGRTVLFVSHNMAAVKNLCNRLMVLKHGQVNFIGDVQTGIERYLSREAELGSKGEIPEDLSVINTGQAKFRKIKLEDDEQRMMEECYYNSPMRFSGELDVKKELKDVIMEIRIKTKDDLTIAYTNNDYNSSGMLTFSPGIQEFSLEMENHLQPGMYTVTLGIHHSDGRTIDLVENVYDFQVLNVGKGGAVGLKYPWPQGYTRAHSNWNFNDR